LTLRSNWLPILWRLFRPHTLTASFIPVSIGAVLAWTGTHRLRGDVFLAMLVASTLIQAATNMFNEYFDYQSGLDTAESVGIAGAITQDRVSPRTILYLAVAACGLALLLGVYICLRSSWWVAAIGVVCMSVGYLYNGGPYPIAATPFGELFAGGFMGTGITLISSFIQQGSVHVSDLLISIPVAVLIGAILTANNIRDRENDEINGRHTLAIYLGHEGAVRFLAGCLVFANLFTVLLVLLHVAPVWALLVLGSLWPATRAVRGFSGTRTPSGMMAGMKGVALTNTVFGVLLLIGLLVP
jgi:1,4-dihydroxy-2-naphthoate polyprenyltransferase